MYYVYNNIGRLMEKVNTEEAAKYLADKYNGSYAFIQAS